MLIRPATEADVPSVLPMVAAICALHESWDKDKYPFLPDIVERYRLWFPQRIADPNSIFLVAELTHSSTGSTPTPGAPLAGYLIATIESEIPIYRLKRFGFIHDVWVEPRHRAQGIARLLVDAAVARFSDLGLTQVRLDTAAPNEPARRLFASCGFRQSTTEMLRVLDTRP
jgi:ribosomal protein S18 acetylase RimI-like enzyme